MVILSVVKRTVVTHCRQYREHLFSSTNTHMHMCYLHRTLELGSTQQPEKKQENKELENKRKWILQGKHNMIFK